MKKQYRFYRKIIQFWLLPKEPFTHVSLQVYSQKLSLIWCILQILHGFWADVDSTAKIQPPTEYWTKKKKEIWDITVLQTNQPTIAYNQRALKESHSTLTIPSRYFSVGHTGLSCLGPPCSPTNLSLSRLFGATTGKAVGMKYWATSLDLLHHLTGLCHQTELLSELLEAPTTMCFQLLAVRSAVHLCRHATHRGMWKREEKILSHPPEISPWKTAPVGFLPECAAERFSMKNPTKSMAEELLQTKRIAHTEKRRPLLYGLCKGAGAVTWKGFKGRLVAAPLSPGDCWLITGAGNDLLKPLSANYN